VAPAPHGDAGREAAAHLYVCPGRERAFRAAGARVDLETRPVARVQQRVRHVGGHARQRHLEPVHAVGVGRSLAVEAVEVDEVDPLLGREPRAPDAQPAPDAGREGGREVRLRLVCRRFVEHVAVDPDVPELDDRREADGAQAEARRRGGVEPLLRGRVDAGQAEDQREQCDAGAHV
jgi:hypothetical protein